jgi:hypothetical protein
MRSTVFNLDSRLSASKTLQELVSAIDPLSLIMTALHLEDEAAVKDKPTVLEWWLFTFIVSSIAGVVAVLLSGLKFIVNTNIPKSNLKFKTYWWSFRLK